jgi:hypothetical protein
VKTPKSKKFTCGGLYFERLANLGLYEVRPANLGLNSEIFHRKHTALTFTVCAINGS